MSVSPKDPTSRSTTRTPWVLRVTKWRRPATLRFRHLPSHPGARSGWAEHTTPGEGV